MRVYLPVSVDAMRSWLQAGSLEPPVVGFAAVLAGVGAVDGEPVGGEADEEAAEYAAFSAAVAELAETAPRLVASVDCEPEEVASLDEPTGRVQVAHPIRWSDVAAVHADDPDAAAPDPLGHLLWFAPAEVADLLARFGRDPADE